MPLVSVSDAQGALIPSTNFAATVYHGVPDNLLQPNADAAGGYLAFLGRIAPEKRVDRAIAIARAAGLPLKIAAKVDKVDQAYFETKIRHLLDQPGVEYVGEISEGSKSLFLRNARALLFPIDWPEPFGLVMIEAMACGTPVLAFRGGSVTEVIDNGISGIIVGSLEEAHNRLGDVLALNRTRVRKCFEERFSAARMAQDYVRVYEHLLDRGISRSRPITLVPSAAIDALH